MRTPWKVIHAVKDTSSSPVVPRFNPAHLRKPSPLPQRPLVPNVFRPPRGQRKIYLPNITVALVRPSPHLPPNHASFLTPLWFNKLDLKDYLYHLYGLEALRIRSYVIQSKIKERGFQGSRRWYRPASKKKMTVELIKDGEPSLAVFEWPEEPKDVKETFDTKDEDDQEREQQRRSSSRPKDERPPQDSRRVKSIAKQLARADDKGETLELWENRKSKARYE